MPACPPHGIWDQRGVFCVSDHSRFGTLSFKKPLLRIEFYGGNHAS